MCSRASITFIIANMIYSKENFLFVCSNISSPEGMLKQL